VKPLPRVNSIFLILAKRAAPFRVFAAAPSKTKSASRTAKFAGEWDRLPVKFRTRRTILLLSAGLAMLLQSSSGAEPETQLSGDIFHSAAPSRVLMVGDSLSVGAFGEALQVYLLQRFGSNNIALYASCGSSPEHWLRSGPKFIARCGYREQTPQATVLYDFQNGRRPQSILTPKLEDIVEAFRPTTVIVQLGTNWMDGFAANSRNESTDGQIIDRFVTAIHTSADSIQQIIWVTPPDSSRYSRETQRNIKDLITDAARRNSFEIIDSSRLTHYVPGKSGDDGVHYNIEAANDWAILVKRELDGMLR
jgi:hypothetical protein